MEINYDDAIVPYVGDLETYLATHALDRHRDFLKYGELLATGRFLDQRITCGRRYIVRAVGEDRYATFIGYLNRVRPGYVWVLTFDELNYISGDGSRVPVKKGGLELVFPREAMFAIYTDNAPLGYGLLDAA